MTTQTEPKLNKTKAIRKAVNDFPQLGSKEQAVKASEFCGKEVTDENVYQWKAKEKAEAIRQVLETYPQLSDNEQAIEASKLCGLEVNPDLVTKRKTGNPTPKKAATQRKVQPSIPTAPVVVYGDLQAVVLKHLYQQRIHDAGELLKKLEGFTANPLFKLVEDCGGAAAAKSTIQELQQLPLAS